jgi:hypothetical protein
VPLLRRQADLKGQLWCGHTDLVDALMRRDPAAARAVIAASNAHWLALVERLSAE